MDYAAIYQTLAKLRLLPRADLDRVFGASSHKFNTNKRLLESEIVAFEKAHDIVLPGDYRGFLKEVGNGGAGPHYGIFKLGYWDGSGDAEPWKVGEVVGKLAQPFPYTQEWNDLSGEPRFDSTRENDSKYLEEFEDELDRFEQGYWRTTNGAMPICTQGCALRYWLVVTGPERGRIWCDFRADRRGWLPEATPASPRVTFAHWYKNWLDEAGKVLSRRS